MSIAFHRRFVLAPCWLTLCWVTLCLAAAGLVTGCGSTQTTQAAGARPRTGAPVRVLYVNATSGAKCELVNDSHSDRTELYSTKKKLGEAFTKVTTDEVMEEVLKQFREVGFDTEAGPGSIPADAQSSAIEIESDGKVTSWINAKTKSIDSQKRFQQCARLFLSIYSNTYAPQAVDETPDWQRQNVPTKKKGQ
jgi:hypothetical protein